VNNTASENMQVGGRGEDESFSALSNKIIIIIIKANFPSKAST
jgi:hypothetical protein